MRDETKMDANRLITEVYKRPALWNQRHISYHNRDVTNRIWMEIAALFKLPKQVLKTKWKGLRDTFRAEIKKEQVCRKSKYTPNRPVWIHFETLQFLKEQMLPRPPVWERTDNSTSDLGLVDPNTRREPPANIADTITITKEDRHRTGKTVCFYLQQRVIETRRDSPADRDALRAGAVVDVNDVSVKDNLSFPAVNSRNQRHTDRHRSRNNNDNNNDNNNNSNEEETTSTIKREPIDRCEDNVEDFENVAKEMVNFDDNGSLLQNISTEEVLLTDTAENNCVIPSDPTVDSLGDNRFDDNYYFFMSLLPHLRTLPAERRMLLRMQMQQLVYQEVYIKTRSPLIHR